MGYSTTVSAASFELDDECSIHSIPAKKRRIKMSLTAKEFDKAIELDKEIDKIKGRICKLENTHAASFDLTWGNMHDLVNEQVVIPRELEVEIVQRIYEWYKNRLKQAEDEFSELVTR